MYHGFLHKSLTSQHHNSRSNGVRIPIIRDSFIIIMFHICRTRHLDGEAWITWWNEALQGEMVRDWECSDLEDEVTYFSISCCDVGAVSRRYGVEERAAIVFGFWVDLDVASIESRK